MTASKKILSLFLFIVVIVILGYFFLIREKGESGEEISSQDVTASKEKVEEVPIPVKADTARIGDLVITLKSPGEAVTNLMVILKSETDGIAKNINVKEGQHVRKGELLVELDDRKFRLDLERDQANRLSRLSELLLEEQFSSASEPVQEAANEKIQNARKELEKSLELYREGTISEEELESSSRKYELALIESGEKKDEVRSAAKGLTQAEISVKTSQLNLEKTKIKAPFSGIITDIQISPQEHISIGRDLFLLVNISQIQVQAKVLESEVGKIKVGRDADLRFSAYPDKMFKGLVEAISPVIDPDDKTCKVTIEVANPQEEIKPGMHAEVEIAAEIHKDRLLIPQAAVLMRQGRKLAFVVENGLAKWRYIQVGQENEQYVEVLPSDKEGERIKEGEIVIIDGHATLAHDARVDVMK